MKQGFEDALIKNLTQPGRYTDAQTRGLNLQVKKGVEHIGLTGIAMTAGGSRLLTVMACCVKKIQ